MFKEIWGGVPTKRVSWETQRSTKAGVTLSKGLTNSVQSFII